MIRSLIIILVSIVLMLDTYGQDIKFTSDYTEWDNSDCKSYDPPEGEGDGYRICPAIEGYKIITNYDIYGFEVLYLESTNNKYETSLTVEYCGATQEYGVNIEWRYADGAPFACIIRYHCLEENEEGFPDEQIGEFLIVQGLEGFDDIYFEVNVRETAKANEKARKLADESYLEYEE